MTSGRLEAFSDGVIAIIITIMVLEMKVPHETDVAALRPVLPVLLSYILSFIYCGIYWNNHHHLFQLVRRVSGGVLWANLHLLFWLSLVPFVTGWMGENHLARLPVALYGIVLLGAGTAYRILVLALLRQHDGNSTLARAVGRDRKGRISVLLYATGIALAALNPWPAIAIYAGVALLWLIPDTRVEQTLAATGREADRPGADSD
jgi:uncharacterized membrane protein